MHAVTQQAYARRSDLVPGGQPSLDRDVRSRELAQGHRRPAHAHAPLVIGIVFETFTKSQKIVNLQRDPRIAVLLEDGTEYNELRGVSISGRAVLYDDPARVHPLALAVMRRNQPEIPEDALDKVAKMMASKRTAVVVKAERTVSWDHGKLGGTY